MKGQRGKQTAIARKRERELKYKQRELTSFLFRVYDLETGQFLGEKYFSGIDSEEAFCNADAWAKRNWVNFNDLHVEEVEM